MSETKDTTFERTYIIGDELVASKVTLLEDELTRFIQSDERDLVLDLVNVTRIDSMSLASLIRVKNRMTELNRQFNLTNPNERVSRVLELAGLDAFLLE